jgi:hypothetical protein
MVKERIEERRRYFEGGGRVFVSITNTRARAIDSVTSHTCVLVADWSAAIETIQEFLAQHRFWADEIDIFTKPRLCEECMRHAVLPVMFDRARHVEECLCWMEGTPCGVHKDRER